MRQTIVFLPGLLCDEALWRHQVVALRDKVDVLIADLTVDESVDAMAARVLAAAPERFALCGLSMGGYVAFAILRAAAARVTRLCLMDTSARPDTEEQSRRRRAFMAMSRANRFRGVTPRLMPQLVHPARLNDTALTGEIMTMADRVGRDAFIRQQTAILARPDSRPDLPRIAVPTLGLVGSDDALTPPPLMEEIANCIPGARFQMIHDAGHMIPMEKPEAVTACLSEWLDVEPIRA